MTEALLGARQRGCAVAEAKTDEIAQSRPFGVIAGALGCVRSAADPRRSAIAELLATHEHSRTGTVTISSDPGLQFRAVDAFADLVEALARQRPLVIGLDDVQWADPSSLLALSAIGRAAIGLPVALFVCYRPLPRSPSMRRAITALDDLGARHVHVRHLAERDVHALVAEALGAEPEAGLLTAVDAAAGNPLFLLELLASLLDEAGTVPGVHRSGGAAGSLPPSLKLIVLRRISALPEQTVRALQAGSLLGSSFSAAELAAITTRPVLDLAPAIETAITAGVLEDGGDRLRFRHDVIRGAIYDDMPASVRLGLHRDAAHRLAAQGTDSTRVAEQFARGAVAGDDEAIDFLTEAAREAMGASPETSAEFLARATELMTPADPRRDLLLAQRADCLMLAGRIAEALDECGVLLGGAHSPDADAPARLRLGAALLVNGWPAKALRELETVAASARTDDQRATALSEAGTARMWLGDFDGADHTATQAHTLAARVGDHRAATAALATRSVVACMHGRIARAMQLNDEALAVADASPDRA
ncbi:MAG: AAA family ATPase, partial [Luteimonas sp.]|nr:AAA family ATPase [Luteimonas sp.]